LRSCGRFAIGLPPDEPLGGLNCALTEPLTTEAFERHATAVGIETIQWLSLTDGDTEERPEGSIFAASRRAPGVLSAIVSAEPIQASTLSMDDGLHFSEQPECTADLAGRWSAG